MVVLDEPYVIYNLTPLKQLQLLKCITIFNFNLNILIISIQIKVYTLYLIIGNLFNIQVGTIVNFHTTITIVTTPNC